MVVLTGPVTTARDLVDHVPTREAVSAVVIVKGRPKMERIIRRAIMLNTVGIV